MIHWTADRIALLPTDGVTTLRANAVRIAGCARRVTAT